MEFKDRHEARLYNEALIRKMFDEGASVKEMMQATGYKRGTVNIYIAKIKAEQAEEAPLTFAKHHKPQIPIIEVDGKKYQDITELFLSSEWRERG